MYFCKSITKDRVWKFDLGEYNFKYDILRGFSFGPIIINTNALWKLIKTNFDVVIINSDPDVAPIVFMAFILSKLRRKKIILWSEAINKEVHFFPSLVYGNTNAFNKIILYLLTFFITKYRKIYLRGADHFLAFSNKAREFLIENKVSVEKITRTYQIIPLDQLPEHSKKFVRNGKTFIYVGYLIPRKNIQLLIRAFKKIDDNKAKVYIVGTGPSEIQLKKLSKNDNRIIFTGNKEGVDKSNLYATSDILVLPSLDDSWGLVVNEAIHYGLGVITSDTIGATELIDTNTGLIFKSNNLEQLYSAMTELINDKKKLKSMQEHNLGNSGVSDIKKASKGFLRAICKVL